MATVPEIEALRREIMFDLHLAVQAKLWADGYASGFLDGVKMRETTSAPVGWQDAKERANKALAERGEAATVNLMRAISALDRVEGDLRTLIEQTGPRFITAG